VALAKLEYEREGCIFHSLKHTLPVALSSRKLRQNDLNPIRKTTQRKTMAHAVDVEIFKARLSQNF
jgi:hypothetical protein